MRRPSNNTNLVNKLKRSIIFGLLLCVVITPAWAGVVQISKINGDRNWFEIKRGEEKIQKFSPFDSLQTGDKICVFKPENDPHHGLVDGKPYSITLLRADNRFETLSYENYPCPKYFEVDQADVPTGEGGVWWAFVDFLVAPWKKDTDEKGAYTKGSGKKEPLVIIPTNVTSKLIEGRFVLYLGTQGNGIFPGATVRLLQQSGKEVPTESLSPGVIKLGEKLIVGQQYTIVVCDNKVSCKDCYSGNLVVPGKQTGTFMVVSSPTLSTEDVEKQLSEVSQKTLKAFQLLGQQDVSKLNGQEWGFQEWGFEVYQQVEDILASSSCNGGEADPKCYPAYLLKKTILEARQQK
ncbi:MAG: hypothetical protein BWK78_05270 [Thiotrichaceae bacterium IS1]|nr:MAG: hypothetical protein BWK78_05270 [Thiotrichaceae bacterium IS1]